MMTQIKLAGPDDVPEIFYMLKRRFSRMPAGYANVRFMPAPSEDEATAKMKRKLSRPNPPFRALVAKNYFGSPVGIAIWYDTFSSWHFGVGMMLEEFFVIGGPHRDGVGLALMRALVSLARASGYVRIEAYPYGLTSPEGIFLTSQEIRMRPLLEWKIFYDDLSESPKDRFAEYDEKYEKRRIVLPKVSFAGTSPRDINDVYIFIRRLAAAQEITGRHIDISAGEAQRRIRSQIRRDNAPFKCVLARDGKEGFNRTTAFASIFRAYYVATNQTFTWIEDIYSAFPKEGKGFAMYKKIYTRARQKKEPFIGTRVLTNSRTAYGAIEFLKKMGMKEANGLRKNMLRLELDEGVIRRLNAGDGLLRAYNIDAHLLSSVR